MSSPKYHTFVPLAFCCIFLIKSANCKSYKYSNVISDFGPIAEGRRLTQEWCTHIKTNGSIISERVCCEGYKQIEYYGIDYCVPNCNEKCHNGFCAEPNQCVCFPDHVRSLAGECVPTCPIHCLNGKCSFDGNCTCNDGYELDSSRHYCIPVCDVPCKTNQNCTGPNFCTCKAGYIYEDSVCKPYCLENCGRSISRHFGYCTEPKHCECHSGYVKNDDGVCQVRDCGAKCTNGYCTEFNYCQCYKGYKSVGNNKGDKVCVPHCHNGCPSGSECVTPNRCKRIRN